MAKPDYLVHTCYWCKRRQDDVRWDKSECVYECSTCRRYRLEASRAPAP